MLEVAMTSFSSTIDETGGLEICYQLTYFSRHENISIIMILCVNYQKMSLGFTSL